mgnify:CR=1 FL=1
MNELVFTVEQEDDGGYVASAEVAPNEHITTQGDTLEELRLIRTERNGRHSETVPNHSPLRIGTLNAILRNVARHFGMSREELADLLFSRK